MREKNKEDIERFKSKGMGGNIWDGNPNSNKEKPVEKPKPAFKKPKAVWKQDAKLEAKESRARARERKKW